MKLNEFYMLSEVVFEAILISENGKIVSINTNLTNLTGFYIEDLKNRDFIDFFTPRYKDLVSQKIVSNNKEFYTAFLVTKDNNEIQVKIQSKKLKIENSEIIIYAIKDLKNELNNETISKQLEHHSKLASMGEMIESIAHQWRQPLNTLGLIISNIKDAQSVNKLNSEIMDRYYKSSWEIIKQMGTTIDDFRKLFSNTKTKQLFNLKDTLESVLNISKPTLKYYFIKIEKNNFEDLYTFGSSGELSQVFLNIINNARDQIHQKKITNGLIKITMHTDDNFIYISFLDNGGGIKDEDLNMIFKLYFTTKNENTGTGIGLHISQSIIQKSFEGDITVKNAENGALFTVKIKKNSIKEN